MGVGVEGESFGVLGVGFGVGVWGAGCGVFGLVFEVWGVRFGAGVLGLRVGGEGVGSTDGPPSASCLAASAPAMVSTPFTP